MFTVLVEEVYSSSISAIRIVCYKHLKSHPVVDNTTGTSRSRPIISIDIFNRTVRVVVLAPSLNVVGEAEIVEVVTLGGSGHLR